MVQWERHLPCEHEDLCLQPKKHIKLHTRAHGGNPSCPMVTMEVGAYGPACLVYAVAKTKELLPQTRNLTLSADLKTCCDISTPAVVCIHDLHIYTHTHISHRLYSVCAYILCIYIHIYANHCDSHTEHILYILYIYKIYTYMCTYIDANHYESLLQRGE